jgi:hypothetical protein
MNDDDGVIPQARFIRLSDVGRRADGRFLA